MRKTIAKKEKRLMSLYQTSVLKNYLNRQDEVIINKAYKKYVQYFHNSTIQENIKKSKEEYHGVFLTELFVNILGYTLNLMPKEIIPDIFKWHKSTQ